MVCLIYDDIIIIMASLQTRVRNSIRGVSVGLFGRLPVTLSLELVSNMLTPNCLVVLPYLCRLWRLEGSSLTLRDIWRLKGETVSLSVGKARNDPTRSNISADVWGLGTANGNSGTEINGRVWREYFCGQMDHLYFLYGPKSLTNVITFTGWTYWPLVKLELTRWLLLTVDLPSSL